MVAGQGVVKYGYSGESVAVEGMKITPFNLLIFMVLYAACQDTSMATCTFIQVYDEPLSLHSFSIFTRLS
jgi:hypothetical protein